MSDDVLARLQITADDTPAYRQLGGQIEALIQAGTLAPGERLPPDRTLARALGVSRTTVVAAYDELKAAGLVYGRQGSGTYVARVLSPRAGWQEIAFAPARRDRSAPSPVISLSHALVPREATPLPALTRLLAEAAAERPDALLEYLPTEGYPPLRYELARLLTDQRLPARADELLVLSGSQQGIDLLARALVRPGDYVALEEVTYPGALAAFRAAGARLLPVPVDGDGLQVEALAALLARYPVRLLYTVPTFHNPTGTVLPLARRQALLEAAARQAVPIVEDSPFDPLFFDRPPPPSLKALDRAGLVYALGSFSKFLGPSLRLGWLAAPPTVINQVAQLKRVADLHASNLAQVAVTRFLAARLLDDHLATLRRLCRRRAEILLAALGQQLPELTVAPVQGGVYAWARLPDGIGAEAVLDEAMARGLTFLPGSLFAVNGGDDGSLRLAYTNLLPPETLVEGVARLAASVRAVAARGGLARAERLVGRVAAV